ncbi:MAG: F0F1 ATP synthase subunit B [Clostridia bacterium]|nr:F0F1 ATP synthase subunit B [Clostridia bacterium]
MHEWLDIISVNLWDVLISLANLAILFLLLKRFLYKPVKAAIAAREEAVAKEYRDAEEAKAAAEADRKAWDERMRLAESEAGEILKQASAAAEKRSDAMLAEARDSADGILRQAKTEAELEKKKAEAGIKQEIVDLSAVLTEKMLSREIRREDHEALVREFLEEIGEKS